MRVEVRGLCKRFGRFEALRGVSFELPAGRRAALIGPNGSGKSTLNRVLMGLLSYEGEVRLDGRGPLDDRPAVARRMAYVPQIAPQMAVPVGELLRAVGKMRGLDTGELRRIAAAFQLDLDAVRRSPFRSLSGGMRQKLLIALALASRASLLLLDEPTGSLDARSRERFFEFFEGLRTDTSLLLCSHRLDEVRPLVDHVLALHEGRLRYDGPAAEFLEARARSVLEVWVEGTAAEERLRKLGFRRSAAGFWIRAATPAEKLEILSSLPAELGSSLRNVNARDLEAIEARPAPGEDGHGA